jgi:hypothetical protein
MAKSDYEQLKRELPHFAEIIKQFPEDLHGKVFDSLMGALHGQVVEVPELKKSEPTAPIPTSANSIVLENLAVKDAIKTESEWMLLIGYNLSNGGQNKFLYKKIKDEYKAAGRDFEHNMTNFSKNLKSTLKQYFSIIDKDNAVIIDAGKNAVQKIVDRGTGSNETAVKSKQKSKATK